MANCPARFAIVFASTCLAVLATIAFLRPALAQSVAPDEMHARTVPYLPPSQVALRSDVNVVDVPVVVRDGQRRAVAGLTRDDFEIYDSGRKQTITSFSEQRFTPPQKPGVANDPSLAAAHAKPAPRLVALCFDDLHTDAPNLKAAKDAAERFVRTSLAPNDRVAIVTTSQPKNNEFSGDVPKLVEQIARLTTHVRSDAWFCPRIQPHEAYRIVNSLDEDLLRAKLAECAACLHNPCPESQVTSLAESIWNQALFNTTNSLRVIEGLVDGMAKLPGQRIIVLASAEFLTGNMEVEIDRLMAKAIHAEVVINTLDARRLFVVFSPRAAGRVQEAKGDGMAELAAGTGGAFYHISNDLTQGFRDLGMVPETMYLLGFTPSNVTSDGRFHNLHVKLVSKKYSLQARFGYTAPSATAAAASPHSALEKELMAAETISDLPARFTWEQPAAGSGITVVTHLDISRMHFLPWQHRRAQRLTIVAVLRDSHGAFVAGKQSHFELNLTESTFAHLAKTTFTASMTLEAPPGSYSVRAVVQDGLDAKLTAANGTVQVK
jgi:VWFA-related protein